MPSESKSSFDWELVSHKPHEARTPEDALPSGHLLLEAPLTAKVGGGFR